MALRIPLLLALACVLAGVPSAAAAVVTLGPNDTVSVVSTKIACLYVDSDNQRGIACEIASNKGLTVGTYGIGISEKGDVIVTKVNSKHLAITTWASRTKASARVHETGYFSLTKGDSFGFQAGGITIGCQIIDISAVPVQYRGRRVVCFRSLKTRPIPNSWGVVMSNKFAGSFRFDSKGNPGKTNADVELQPK